MNAYFYKLHLSCIILLRSYLKGGEIGYNWIMSIVVNWIVSGMGILITSYVLPGVHVEGFVTALKVAIVLGIVNAIIKPILIILTLPINILTLGLFTFVINAMSILLTSYIVSGFLVDSFLWALLFSLVLSVINSVLQQLVRSE